MLGVLVMISLPTCFLLTVLLSCKGCRLSDQTYAIHSIVVHQRYPYYGGTFFVQSQSFPVCFAFDSQGSFYITLDGQGSCPTIPASPACIQVGASVSQIWSGSFKGNSSLCTWLIAAIPQGVYKGAISILPYTTTSSGAQCLSQCSAIVSTSALTFSGSSLRIDIDGGTSREGCRLNRQVRIEPLSCEEAVS